MTCIEDTFSRPDGPLGTAETGETWSTVGTYVVEAGKAYQSTPGINGSATVPAARNVRVEGQFTLGSGSAEIGLVARDEIGLMIDRDRDHDRLALDLPGASAAAVWQPAGFVLGQSYEIALELRGRTAWGYVDGILRLFHSFDPVQDAPGLGAGIRHHRSTAYSNSDAGGSRVDWIEVCPLPGGMLVGAVGLGG